MTFLWLAATFSVAFGSFFTGTFSEESWNPCVASSLEGISFVKECVRLHPEILWLADENVRKTEEGQATLQGPYSVQLVGKKYIEFDRTLMTLHCLKLILDGSKQAYEEFTAAQPGELKLSWKSFRELNQEGQYLLQSGLKGMSAKQIAQAMETALVLGDIGKTEKARKLFQEIQAPDHDDFYGEAMRVLERLPEICPSFAKLHPSAKKLLVEVANLAHYGHVTHLEGGPNMFCKLRESGVPIRDPNALRFDLFVHLCDVTGALGHVNNESSLVYTEPAHQAMQSMRKAVMVLAKSKTTELDAYETYLKERAAWLDLNLESPSDRVLTCMGAMLRLYTKEEGETLTKALSRLDVEMQCRIIRQFDVTHEARIGRTPTYMPAVLVNLANHSKLGVSKEERLSAAIAIGLPLVTRVLEEHRKLLEQGKIDPLIPLNFNGVAGEAKQCPLELSHKEFSIDQDGNVLLR